MESGIHMKYFVLNPHKDDAYGLASRSAMLDYAEAIKEENPSLATDLEQWVFRIEGELWGPKRRGCPNPMCVHGADSSCANPIHKEDIMWKQYRRTGLSEMRPYAVGEDLSGVSVGDEDTPKQGDMIARNPKNHDDQWLVAKEYFEDNLEEVR